MMSSQVSTISADRKFRQQEKSETLAGERNRPPLSRSTLTTRLARLNGRDEVASPREREEVVLVALPGASPLLLAVTHSGPAHDVLTIPFTTCSLLFTTPWHALTLTTTLAGSSPSTASSLARKSSTGDDPSRPSETGIHPLARSEASETRPHSILRATTTHSGDQPFLDLAVFASFRRPATGSTRPTRQRAKSERQLRSSAPQVRKR
ncbi:RHTO0S04e05930g1_1 [Rhodotorula toruloides]|uniref:RHTO0S04e05930g1_1 n=2 Tax=Rhodotorula toruloides TaxID=5286 RepID=A0A061APS0_RHOTO|nr:uncharacterized protein RHTO_02012 [Rhodotorula toruloides NP11]EMS21141.1 hypothetical protein RHTO_02012 [Rhodotorula toruloides NP11]CDR39514.1 RHTO0S04e05930g1_1 [Rhodotorula toruloides]